MQVKSQRRVHRAEFKAQVLSECQQLGASVAAVALKHGLNANLVRSWLGGRGLKRSGLPDAAEVAEAGPGGPPNATAASAALRFVPVELGSELAVPASGVPESCIRIELAKGQTKLSVQWPASHAASCSSWLRDLVAVAR